MMDVEILAFAGDRLRDARERIKELEAERKDYCFECVALQKLGKRVEEAQWLSASTMDEMEKRGKRIEELETTTECYRTMNDNQVDTIQRANRRIAELEMVLTDAPDLADMDALVFQINNLSQFLKREKETSLKYANETLRLEGDIAEVRERIEELEAELLDAYRVTVRELTGNPKFDTIAHFIKARIAELEGKMQFILEHCPMVVDGRKTQTRRLWKEGDALIETNSYLHWVENSNGRLRWMTGKTYAVCPGRGKKAIGRTPPIKSIRLERLQDISPEDCWAEGIDQENVGDDQVQVRRGMFANLWDILHKHKANQWDANPKVWRLEFERIG